MSKRRSMIVVSLISVAFLNPSPVGAVDYGTYGTEYLGDKWQEWFGLNNGAIADPPTAEMTANDYSACLEFNDPGKLPNRGADGDEFDFTFVIEGGFCEAAVQLNGDPRLVASFNWTYLNGREIPVDFPCLDVTGTVVSESDPEAEIIFSDNRFYGALAGYPSGSNSDRLADVSEVYFELWSDALTSSSIGASAEGVGTLNGSLFEISITIDECGGWEGPDIDIEHYRRRAEQATALPDTI